MITSQHENWAWVLQHVSEKQHDRLNGLFPSINVISKKKIFELLWWEPIFLEYFNKIRKLAMNVANNDQWGLNF